MVGVFGAGKVVCFGSPEWDQKLELIGQFSTAQVRLETAFGWSYLCVVMLWIVPMNCRIFIGPCEPILVLFP